MIKLIFEQNAYCFINGEDITLGNGKCVDAFIPTDDYYEKAEGYLMLDKGNNYLDVCKTYYDENGSEVECPVIAHLALVDVVTDKDYDQAFVEKFHPDYNCDEIAWLDDRWCAIDNETSNASHWIYLAEEVGLTDDESAVCNAIYDELVNDEPAPNEIVDIFHKMGFNTMREFGEYLSEKYASEIMDDINSLEDEIMADAIKNFKKRIMVA